MTGAWIAIGMLTVFALVEAVAIVALAREVGLLARRLPPAPALVSDDGPELGVAAPQAGISDLRSGTWRASVHSGARALVVFLTTGCSPCQTLLEELDAARRDWPEVEFVPVITGRLSDAESMVRAAGYAGPAYHDHGTTKEAFKISSTPLAVAVDERGVVVARGITNSREMVSSLLEGNVRAAGGLRWLPVEKVES